MSEENDQETPNLSKPTLFHPKLDPLYQEVKKIKNQDWSYNEQLGLQSGFHEVNNTKNFLIESIENLLDQLYEVVDELPTTLLESEIKKIESDIASIQKLHAEINTCAKSKHHYNNPRYTREEHRNNIHNSAKGMRDTLINKYDLLYIYIKSLKAYITTKQANFSEISKKLTKTQELINQESEKIEKLKSTIEDSANKLHLQKSKSHYSHLASKHKYLSICWFVGVVISFLALLGVVTYITLITDIQQTINSTQFIFKKILLIGTSLLILKTCLTKYNSERHLNIIYNHRSTAIDELELLEMAISDDTKAKASLRVEAAKMMLSDPNTGYSTHSEGSELNISPIFSALDKSNK